MSAKDTLPTTKLPATDLPVLRLPVVSIPKAGKILRLQADAAQLQQIVGHLGLASCEQVSADLTLEPARGDAVHVTGTVKARLHQACVITLDAVPVTIVENIDVRFAPPEKLGPISKAEIERTLEDEDPPEPLENGSIDVWALAIDHIAVALDPYPRKPGATLAADIEPPIKESPFAALAALKKGLEKS
jgi:uncharacterized metal-binding protein YceD (DUF177 family)